MAIGAGSGARILSAGRLQQVGTRKTAEKGLVESKEAAMSSARVAVIGAGISGAVCASMLAGRGIAVTVFDSGRGPGGRMSQRREHTEKGDLLFDHGAPYFTVENEEVMNVVSSWEKLGLVTEWNEKFGCFDMKTFKFMDLENDEKRKKYVGVPGMNAIPKSLCSQPGIETNFGTKIEKLDWLEGRNSWLLFGSDGENLGHFNSIVVSDKNLFSFRHSGLSGKPSPLDATLFPDLAEKLQDIPVRPCYALMLAFSEPLLHVPVKGFYFKNSGVLKQAFCDSSKPGRFSSASSCECWVLHSTAEYAAGIISKTGLKKHSPGVLSEIAEELYKEFESTGLVTSRPFFMKAHRWGSAFPDLSIGGEDMCLWDDSRRLAICGDFCVSPSVEGALLSGMRAASKLSNILSSL